MGRKTLDLLMEGIDDELNVAGWDPLDRFLNDMIAILVLDASQHIILQLFDNAGLLVDQHMFQCLTQNSVNAHRRVM